MTFKEQMQQKAETEFPFTTHNNSSDQDCRRYGYLIGSQAALSSDLVKGLVDAGDKILEWWKQDEETGTLNADDVMDALNAALTNYKNEVKQ